MTLLDTPTIPDVSAEDRALRLLEAGTSWNDRIAAKPASALLTYRVRGTGEGAVATRLTAGKHEFLLPLDQTHGRRKIRVRVKFTPVTTPLFPGRELAPLAWSEIRYGAYCFVLPPEIREP